MNERTLIILKPDCIKKNLIGTVLKIFEENGLHIAACKMIQMTDNLLKQHYSALVNESFFGFLCDFMKSTPVIVAVLDGENAITKTRQLLGATNSAKADPKSIRGQFGDKEIVTYNICHASDAPETAKKEIERFFTSQEIF